MTINLTGDKNVKTFTDFWQKMIDEDLIDTKTVGWTDDWNKGLDDGSIASLLTGAWMPYNLLSGAPNGGRQVAHRPDADRRWLETNSENGGSSLAIVKSDDKAKVAAAYKFMDTPATTPRALRPVLTAVPSRPTTTPSSPTTSSI